MSWFTDMRALALLKRGVIALESIAELADMEKGRRDLENLARSKGRKMMDLSFMDQNAINERDRLERQGKFVDEEEEV